MDSNKKETKTRFSISEKDFIGNDYQEYENFRAYVRMISAVFLGILITWLAGGKLFKEEVKNYYTPIYKNVKFTSFVDKYHDRDSKSTTPLYQINGTYGGNYVSLYSTDNDLVDVIDSAGELTSRKLKYRIGNTYKMNISPTNQVGVANGVVIFGVIILFISLGISGIFLFMSICNIWSESCIYTCGTRAVTTKAKLSLLIYEVLSLLIPLTFVICSFRWIYFWAIA